MTRGLEMEIDCAHSALGRVTTHATGLVSLSKLPNLEPGPPKSKRARGRERGHISHSVAMRIVFHKAVFLIILHRQKDILSFFVHAEPLEKIDQVY